MRALLRNLNNAPTTYLLICLLRIDIAVRKLCRYSDLVANLEMGRQTQRRRTGNMQILRRICMLRHRKQLSGLHCFKTNNHNNNTRNKKQETNRRYLGVSPQGNKHMATPPHANAHHSFFTYIGAYIWINNDDNWDDVLVTYALQGNYKSTIHTTQHIMSLHIRPPRTIRNLGAQIFRWKTHRPALWR